MSGSNALVSLERFSSEKCTRAPYGSKAINDSRFPPDDETHLVDASRVLPNQLIRHRLDKRPAAPARTRLAQLSHQDSQRRPNADSRVGIPQQRELRRIALVHRAVDGISQIRRLRWDIGAHGGRVTERLPEPERGRHQERRAGPHAAHAGTLDGGGGGDAGGTTAARWPSKRERERASDTAGVAACALGAAA